MWCCPSLTRPLKWLACRDKAAAHALGHPVRVERGRHGLVSTRSPSSRASCMVLEHRGARVAPGQERQLGPPLAQRGAERWWIWNARNGALYDTVPGTFPGVVGRCPPSLPSCPQGRGRRRLPSSSAALSSPAAASQCSAAPSGRWWKRNARNGALHVTVLGAANLITPHPHLQDARTPAIFTISCVQVLCCNLQTCNCYASGSRGRAPEPVVLLHKTHARQHHPIVPVRQTHARKHRPADVRRRHQPPGPG